MSNTALPTSRYKIVNAYTKNDAQLPDPIERSAIVGNTDNGSNSFKWSLDLLSNGRYSIKNFGQGKYAYTGIMPPSGSHVVGSSTTQQWIVNPLGSDKYTICTIDNNLYWYLENDSPETPVTLAANGTNNKAHWTITPA